MRPRHLARLDVDAVAVDSPFSRRHSRSSTLAARGEQRRSRRMMTVAAADPIAIPEMIAGRLNESVHGTHDDES